MRKATPEKKQPSPDIRYNNPVIGKFINYVMHEGKKSIARAVVYDAFNIVAEKTKKDPVTVFDEAIKNSAPTTEVKSRRVGGANYQVPTAVRSDRRMFLAMNWIIRAARAKTGSTMAKRLAEEVIAAANNEGIAVKRKEDMHRMAQANKAFAHFSGPQ